MAKNHKNPGAINPLLVAVVGILGSLVFGCLVPMLLIQMSDELTWNQYRSELFRASMTVATGILLSVVVAMLVENHRLRSARRQADREIRRTLIAQLRDVHDQVKAAALLINAHKSARTYGEQMRRLIEVRVRLLDAMRAISSESRPFQGEDETLKRGIASAAAYLDKLAAEYEDQYLRVSQIQSYSHEWDQAQARAASQLKDPPTPDQMKSSLVPWTELNGPAFPRLKALREADAAKEVHKKEFSDPLGKTIDLLHALNEKSI